MAFAYSDHSALKRRIKGGNKFAPRAGPANFEVSGHGEVFVGVIMKISTIFHNIVYWGLTNRLYVQLYIHILFSVFISSLVYSNPL